MGSTLKGQESISMEGISVQMVLALLKRKEEQILSFWSRPLFRMELVDRKANKKGTYVVSLVKHDREYTRGIQSP